MSKFNHRPGLMEYVWTLSMFSLTVRVIFGLCTDLAQTQLGHGWLVKQNIHLSLVLVQSEHSLRTVTDCMESMWTPCESGGGV
jgi:hypothetical protein